MIRSTTQFLAGLLAFVRATVIGGVFVLAPIAVLIAIIGQATQVAIRLLQPVMKFLPFESIAGISSAVLAAVSGITLLCFLAGLLAITTVARWLVKSIEAAVLSNLPGYALMKSMGEGMVGLESRDGRRAVLVRFEHTSQIGFQMSQLPDGRAVVFIPGVPSPWSGQLHIVPPDRFEILPVSVRSAMETLQRLGLDADRFLSPAPAVATPAPLAGNPLACAEPGMTVSPYSSGPPTLPSPSTS